MENVMRTQIKKSAKIILLTALLAAPFTAQANWFGNNGEWKVGPNGSYWDDSGWPTWTPMYWMDEMMDTFDNDNNNYYNNTPYRQGPYHYATPTYPSAVIPRAPQVAITPLAPTTVK